MKKPRKSKKKQSAKKSKKSQKKQGAKQSKKQHKKKQDVKQPKELQKRKQVIEITKEQQEQKQDIEKPKITEEKEQELEQTQEVSVPGRTLVIAFSGLFLSIGLIMGLSFLFKNSLFLSLEYLGTFVVYAGFVLISLVAAVAMFGVMQRTGVFKKSTWKYQFEFGGPMAGFLATLMFLIGTYSFHTPPPTALKIIGNVSFVEDGKPVWPVRDVKIALSKYSGYETETDRNGNFTLRLPEDKQIHEIELLAAYEG